MKQIYFRHILLLSCLLAGTTTAFADAVVIDGISYNLVSKMKIAEVTSNPNKYKGAVNIPATVTYNDVTYSVTSIGIYTFRECTGLTSVTIPENVTSISLSAFRGCSSLTDVYCLAEDVPATSDDAFLESSIESATLYVPAASLEAYKTTQPWSGFGTIVGLTEDEIDAVEDVQADGEKAEEARYDLQGHRATVPHKGINIVRYSDGTTRKVLVK